MKHRLRFLALLVMMAAVENAAADTRPEQARLVSSAETLAEPEPLPLRWLNGWVLVAVRINGADAGWFKIATGWEFSAIDSEVASRLKLRVISPLGALKALEEIPGAKAKTWHRADVLECGAVKGEGVWLMDGGEELKSMSQHAMETYGEGISGVLGWDLLSTHPFLLDYPNLALTWQRQPAPEQNAVKIPLLEPHSFPMVEVLVGEGVTARATVNTAGTSVTFENFFLRTNQEKLWRGRVSGGSYKFFFADRDDDRLIVGPLAEGWPSERWVTVQIGGHQVSSLARLSEAVAVAPNDLQIGYSVLRGTRVLFDGPGIALWLSAASTVPEVQLVIAGRPRPQAAVLARLMESAVFCDDAQAVRALASAGVPVEASKPESDGPLAEACKTSARGAAFALLAAGAEPNPGGLKPEHYRPLHYAARIGDAELVKALLKKGAKSTGLQGTKALMSATSFGNAAVVEILRNRAPFPRDWSAAQLVREACGGGNVKLAKEWWAAHRKANPDAAAWCDDFTVGLEQALILGHEDVAAWLLKIGGAGAAKEGDKLQPLLAAILPARVEKTDAVRERLVTMLLAAKADPNASSSGVTPLLLAARHGNAAILRALLAAGAGADATDFKGRHALHRAAAANQPAELIVPLLGSGIDPDSEDPSSDATPLAMYAAHGNVRACDALLSAGAKPDAKSSFGMTPLVHAVAGFASTDEEALAVVSLLLKHGAKPEKVVLSVSGSGQSGVLSGAIKTGRSTLLEPLVTAGIGVSGDLFQGVTPLAMAAAISTPATVGRLIELGADPKAVDNPGISVLGHAAAAGRLANMELLLKKGASPGASVSREMPPLWVAANTGQLTAARMLLTAGADPSATHPTLKTSAIEEAARQSDPAMLELLKNPPPKQ